MESTELNDWLDIKNKSLEGINDNIHLSFLHDLVNCSHFAGDTVKKGGLGNKSGVTIGHPSEYFI